MRTKFGRTVRTMGVALVLASGAGVVLGTAPASATEYKFLSIVLRYHGDKFPSRTDAINETRPEADRQCVAAYGFRARGVEPGSLFGVRNSQGTNDWKQTWYCYPN
ncbi:hypothetical protein UK23_36370 [Lentzea aerocolonigenes]|uniref:Uncharacterized protein n=1 Tax=Lentzea aerocolonigenes TaxID=68170 RepID=A0A0F0GKY4_LENAE|nr:hypothetical protein [Lentzea aerocolonigenes]KJK42632.1 hypothetical protein UK23_36370 [Lentzea aerocolonigenes]